MRLRTLLLVNFSAIALFVAGCTSPAEANDVPIIDSVEAPSVVTSRNGNYEIPLLILFHDNDREAVTHVRYRLKGTRIEGVIDVATPIPTRESVYVTVVVPKADCGRAPRHALEVTILDARGGESHPHPQVVALD